MGRDLRRALGVTRAMSSLIAIQADREAAAALVLFEGPRQRILAGLSDDGPAVQAFARHRIAEQERVVKWLRARAAMWNRLAVKSEARGDGEVSRSQAGIAASYEDHAASIERGDHEDRTTSRGAAPTNTEQNST